MLFHLEKPTEYYVESNGVRSGRFTLSVVDLPTVSELQLEYRFPAYTGLAPRKADGGDVAAIRGTEVFLHVVPTMTTPGGSVLLNDGHATPLTTQPDGSLTGAFTIEGQGFYRIELDRPARREGGRVAAVHDRRHRRSAAVGALHQAGPRHAGQPGRGALPRSARRRRLRREVAAAVLFGQRRAAEDDQPVRRPEAAPRSERRPHDLSRGARAEAGRLRLVLRQGDRHRHGAGTEDDDERHLLRADPAVQEGLQAGAVAGGRRRRRRRRPAGRPALAAAARNRRRDVQHRPRQGEDQAGQVPRERRVPEPRAGEAARAGGRARRQAEGAARLGGSVASTRSRRCCRRRPRK